MEPWDANLRTGLKQNCETTNNESTVSVEKDKCNEMIIDSKLIPFILRVMEGGINTCLLPVEAIERRLLSSFPAELPEQMKNRPSLRYVAATSSEKEQICTRVQMLDPECRLVEYNSFMQFYELLKKCHVFEKINKINTGWIFVNQSIVPYATLHKKKYSPLAVIDFALKGYLSRNNIKSDLCCSTSVFDALNKACQKAGIIMSFNNATQLLDVDKWQGFASHFKILPPGNPKEQVASLNKSFEDENMNTSQIAGKSRKIKRKSVDDPLQSSLGIVRKLSKPSNETNVHAESDENHSECLPSPSEDLQAISADLCTKTNVIPVSFNDKTLASTQRGQQIFVLLDAVTRVYFSLSPPKVVEEAITHELQNCCSSCTLAEERAYLKFYMLPLEKLPDNKLINFKVFCDKYQNIIEYIKRKADKTVANSSKTDDIDCIILDCD